MCVNFKGSFWVIREHLNTIQKKYNKQVVTACFQSSKSIYHMSDKEVITEGVSKDIVDIMDSFVSCKRIFVIVNEEGNTDIFMDSDTVYISNLNLGKGDDSKMNKETESVINYIKENKDLVKEYIEYLGMEDKNLLSYSGFLMHTKLNGTTKEGVDFNSSRVVRREVSAIIRKIKVELEGEKDEKTSR